MKLKLYFLWLSLVCIGVFVLQNLPGIPGFTDVFILNESAVYSYQIWRFVSAIFLHGSITHLLYNLFALLFFGFILEKQIGSRKFLIVFFSSGIIANLISVNFYNSSLGASGAIYGILGALAIINPMMMVWAFGMILPMFIAAILWVIGDLLRIFGLFDPGNVGSIAHLSGVAAGLVMGIIIRFFKNRKVDESKEIKEEVDERKDDDVLKDREDKGADKLKVKDDVNDDYMKEWENKYMK